MSVISPARTQHLTITTPGTLHATRDLRHLTTPQRTLFNQLMAGAADATTPAAIRAFHTTAAAVIDMRLPASGEITQCGCPTCYCLTIFDAADARTYAEGDTEIVQCPDCADNHRYGDQP